MAQDEFEDPRSQEPEPVGIDVNKLIDVDEVTWAEKKDQLVTRLAIFVIGVSAVTSCIALLWRTFFPYTAADPTNNWALDVLTLSLVASLSFVMGSNSKSE